MISTQAKLIVALTASLVSLSPFSWFAESAPRAAYGRQADSGATLRGKVLFDGERPKLEPLDIPEESSKGCCLPGEAVDRTNRGLLLSKQLEIANVVIEVKVPGNKIKSSKRIVQMDNKDCRFEPHVVIVPVGSKLEFKNSDKASHNVHTWSTRNVSINKTVSEGSVLEISFKRPDKIRVACDIHPWMSGWIYVTDSPFVALTDEHGAFEIKGLPPGKYKANVWHESLAKQTLEVVIGAEEQDIKVLWKMEVDDGKKRRR